MKIIADNGERIVIQAPAHLGSSCMVSIVTEFYGVIDITIVDGLIDHIDQRVCYRDGRPNINVTG